MGCSHARKLRLFRCSDSEIFHVFVVKRLWRVSSPHTTNLLQTWECVCFASIPIFLSCSLVWTEETRQQQRWAHHATFSYSVRCWEISFPWASYQPGLLKRTPPSKANPVTVIVHCEWFIQSFRVKFENPQTGSWGERVFFWEQPPKPWFCWSSWSFPAPKLCLWALEISRHAETQPSFPLSFSICNDATEDTHLLQCVVLFCGNEKMQLCQRSLKELISCE